MADEPKKITFQIIDADISLWHDTLPIFIDCGCLDEDTESVGGTLSIPVAIYSDGKWVEDEKAEDAADKTLHDLFGLSLDDVYDDPEILIDQTFEGYPPLPSDDRSRIRLSLYSSYQKFDKLDARGARSLKSLSYPVMTTPIVDHNFHGTSRNDGHAFCIQRIEAGILAPDGKCYRIARIKIETEDADVSVPLDYCSAEAKKKYTAVDTGEADQERAGRLLRLADLQTKGSRAGRVAKIDEALNCDLDSYLDRGIDCAFRVTDVSVLDTSDGRYKYIIATVDALLPVGEDVDGGIDDYEDFED